MCRWVRDNPSRHPYRNHKYWRAGRAGRFELSLLPAASPEPNPLERVWKLTPRRRLHNRHFRHLDSIHQAVESAFDEWHTPNETLRRVCAVNQDAVFSFSAVNPSS